MIGIRVRDLCKSYAMGGGRRKPVLDRVSFSVGAGEFCCVLGPSGCGKTTLLNLLCGIDRDYDGEIVFEGAGGAPSVGYVFQDARLLPWLTVWDNLAFVVDRERMPGWREQIEQRLRLVGLGEQRGAYPGQLSAGMQQRVAVARALLVRPQVLLMDEPFSSLDEITASRLRDELLGLWEGSGLTVVFVTHNPLEAAYLADRVLVLSAGPARVQGELDVRGALARPRTPGDTRVWQLARQAVALLEQGLGQGLEGADPLGCCGGVAGAAGAHGTAGAGAAR